MADRLRREDGGEDCVDDAWREAAGSLLFGVLEPEPMELLRKFINVASPFKGDHVEESWRGHDNFDSTMISVHAAARDVSTSEDPRATPALHYILLLASFLEKASLH